MRRVAWNTPVRMVGRVCTDAAVPATAHLALTQAAVDPDHRAEFDRASIELLRLLPGVPGLLMYSIRREFLGEKAWTMTAWRTTEDRRAFASSCLHGRAMLAGGHAVRGMKSLQLEWPAHELPLAWSMALRLLGSAPARSRADPD